MYSSYGYIWIIYISILSFSFFKWMYLYFVSYRFSVNGFIWRLSVNLTGNLSSYTARTLKKRTHTHTKSNCVSCVWLTRWWRFGLVIPDDHDFGQTLDQGQLGDDLEQGLRTVVGQDHGGESLGTGWDQREEHGIPHSFL